MACSEACSGQAATNANLLGPIGEQWDAPPFVAIAGRYSSRGLGRQDTGAFRVLDKLHMKYDSPTIPPAARDAPIVDEGILGIRTGVFIKIHLLGRQFHGLTISTRKSSLYWSPCSPRFAVVSAAPSRLVPPHYTSSPRGATKSAWLVVSIRELILVAQTE